MGRLMLQHGLNVPRLEAAYSAFRDIVDEQRDLGKRAKAARTPCWLVSKGNRKDNRSHFVRAPKKTPSFSSTLQPISVTVAAGRHVPWTCFDPPGPGGLLDADRSQARRAWHRSFGQSRAS